jgi:hypothetical protein
MNTDKLDNFIQAFSSHTGGCRRTCHCGKEFWDNTNGYDWEPGEVEALEKDPAARALAYSVSTISLEGREYVMDCICFHERAEQVMRFIDGHAQAIAEYLTLEKKRKQRIADEAPTVE